MPKPEQPAHTGAGPLLERRYYIDIESATHSPEALMTHIQGHVEAFSPNLLADFHKEKGEDEHLREGDEFHIKIAGPWNGSVRVAEVAPDHFDLCTLDGHPEAGRIRFSLTQRPEQPDALRFEIHSWARSRDGLVAFMYDTLGVGKRVQEQTWVMFCERVAEASGGRALGPVHVETVKQENGRISHEQHDS